MDDKMMTQLLATYGKGIPLSAQNANAIRQFGASNPDILERRAQGMRGSGLDDNSDLLDSMLDKHIADTAPAGRVEVGQPVLDKKPAIPAAAAVPARAPSKLQTGETGGEPMQVGTTINGGQPLVPVSKQQDAAGGGFDLGHWLTALLGVTSAGALTDSGGRAAAPGQPDIALPPHLQPSVPEGPAYMPGGVPERSPVPSGPDPYADGVRGPHNPPAPNDQPAYMPPRNAAGQTPSDIAGLKGEVADENDAMARKIMDDIRKRNTQAGADATVNAARRLLRR